MVDLDVVVDAQRDRLPLGVGEGLRGERLQRRTIEALEELPPARAVLLHLAVVQHDQQLGDARVELGHREEGLVAQRRQQPPLGLQHADLDLRLVPRLARPCRQDRRAVVPRHLLVGALDAGLVAAGLGDPAPQLVADRGLGHAPVELVGADVTRDEVGPALRGARLGVGVAGGAEHRDEQLDLDHLAGLPIDDARLLARVVHERLLPGAMDLVHRQLLGLRPAGVVLAELGVLVAVRMLCAVLEVEQGERHALAAQLRVDLPPVRQRPGLLDLPRRAVHPSLELRLVERLDLRPLLEPGHLRPLQHVADGARADIGAPGHGPMAELEQQLLPEDLLGLAHGQSLRGHRSSCTEADDLERPSSVAVLAAGASRFRRRSLPRTRRPLYPPVTPPR